MLAKWERPSLLCTSTVRNIGTLNLAAQPLRHGLVRLGNASIVSQADSTAAIAAVMVSAPATPPSRSTGFIFST